MQFFSGILVGVKCELYCLVVWFSFSITLVQYSSMIFVDGVCVVFACSSFSL